ncbi:MAG: lipid-A-disaccharide synthase [Verrucomicrobia bacterium]|nr:lipid-A-disaccharide synthase [Verrucomicrobiota bacterium]
MNPTTFMLIAGETSGDMLAAELVKALAAASPAAPRFIGAGGPKMAEAGVELAFDLTQHSVIGLWEVLKNYFKFRRLFFQLLDLAFERKPDCIVCVDFSGFNRRFAHAVRARIRRTGDAWRPKIVQYVSPQVWASRPGRANAMAHDYDLLLAILPFEQAWYAKHAPELRVEFVGHPIVERHGRVESGVRSAESAKPLVLLLPGSRVGELKRHLPVMLPAWEKISAARTDATARMVLPNEDLKQLALGLIGDTAGIEIQIGGLTEALQRSTIAIASTGTVTLECAFFGVPTVALYKTSWLTYQIGKRIVQVKYLAMPNLLADERLFPEFVQGDASAENLASAALELLDDPARRTAVKTKLAQIVATLGGPGASARAAQAIRSLLPPSDAQ